jgi:hypothetical protein
MLARLGRTTEVRAYVNIQPKITASRGPAASRATLWVRF